MPDTSIIVGSVPLAEQTVTINAGAETFPAGNYYLRHTNASLSLIGVMATVLAAAGVAAATVTVRRNLRVRMGGSAFSVSWGSATFLRDLLGFTQGDLSSGVQHDAESISPLLWAAGFLGTPRHNRAGKEGYTIPHVTRFKASDGSRQETQSFGEEKWLDLDWSYVPTERLSVPDDEFHGGTFEALFETSLRYGYNLFYHEEVIEDSTTNALSWNDAQAFGPYAPRDIDEQWYRRLVANTDDVGGPAALELHLVEEYD